jgi:hypothetical protein
MCGTYLYRLLNERLLRDPVFLFNTNTFCAHNNNAFGSSWLISSTLPSQVFSDIVGGMQNEMSNHTPQLHLNRHTRHLIAFIIIIFILSHGQETTFTQKSNRELMENFNTADRISSAFATLLN